MLEVLQIVQMAQFVGVTLPIEELLEASHDAGMADHLWDVVDDFYEVALQNEEWNRLVQASQSLETWPSDTEWADGLPF